MRANHRDSKLRAADSPKSMPVMSGTGFGAYRIIRVRTAAESPARPKRSLNRKRGQESYYGRGAYQKSGLLEATPRTNSRSRASELSAIETMGVSTSLLIGEISRRYEPGPRIVDPQHAVSAPQVHVPAGSLAGKFLTAFRGTSERVQAVEFSDDAIAPNFPISLAGVAVGLTSEIYAELGLFPDWIDVLENGAIHLEWNVRDNRLDTFIRPDSGFAYLLVHHRKSDERSSVEMHSVSREVIIEAARTLAE